MQPAAAWTGEGVQPELGPCQQNFDFVLMLTELVIDSTILGEILKFETVVDIKFRLKCSLRNRLRCQFSWGKKGPEEFYLYEQPARCAPRPRSQFARELG